MDVYETVKNIRSFCDNYIDPDLVTTIIDENNFMGKNNIQDLEGYDFSDGAGYEEKFMKVHEKENLFTYNQKVFQKLLNTILRHL